MKKFTIFLLILLMAVTSVFTFSGCRDENVIKVNEVTHSIFYAPFYIAINNGYFEEEGYEIRVVNGGGSDSSMTALISGAADIALLGPETNVYVISQGRTDYPVIFGQLTKRDGSFLVSRVPEPDFEWTDLANKYIIGGRRGGSPAMSLEYALKQNGLVPGVNVALDLNVAFNMTVGAFEGGLGDYVTMFEPIASDYQAEGKGYIVASVGEESGEVPFTCFSANRSYLNSNPDKIDMFLKCIIRAYNFILESDIEDVIDSLLPSFPSSSRNSIKFAIESYIRIDAWMTTPVMLDSAFTRLQDVMIAAGELNESNRVSFSDAVDNSFAERVLETYFS